MKKLIYLFLTVLIVSCSSDDNSNTDACPGQDALLEQYEDAAVAFADSPSSTTCPAYISSLELLFNVEKDFQPLN